MTSKTKVSHIVQVVKTDANSVIPTFGDCFVQYDILEAQGTMVSVAASFLSMVPEYVRGYLHMGFSKQVGEVDLGTNRILCGKDSITVCELNKYGEVESSVCVKIIEVSP